jgi:antitoxin component of RelBE/YafQ-DinJ toxin-antitoxin module
MNRFTEFEMPISLRIDDALSDQLDRASVALGVPKSALIRRGIEEILRTVSAPSAQALYAQTLPIENDIPKSSASHASQETRGHKRAFQQAMAKKQAERKTRARTAVVGSARTRAPNVTKSSV